MAFYTGDFISKLHRGFITDCNKNKKHEAAKGLAASQFRNKSELNH